MGGSGQSKSLFSRLDAPSRSLQLLAGMGKSAGMVPFSRFFCSCMLVTFVMLDHDGGSGPVMELECSHMRVTSVMLDHDAGSGPVMELECSSMCVTFVMFDHDGGSGPWSLLAYSFTSVMRPSLHVILPQPHGSSRLSAQLLHCVPPMVS